MYRLSSIIFFILFCNQLYANITCSDYADRICEPSQDFTYCDQDLIRSYSGNLFQPLNTFLRGLNNDNNCEALAISLEKAILKLPKVKKMKVYRGNRYLRRLAELKKNECYFDTSFLSTSKKIDIAWYFAPDQHHVLFEIITKTGRDISNIALGFEEEVLLLPDTYLKLKKTTYFKGKKLLKFVEVNKNECI